MNNFDVLNKRIIQSSVVQYTAQQKESYANNKTPQFASSSKKSYAKDIMLGLTALGGITYAIIRLSKGKPTKGNKTATDNVNNDLLNKLIKNEKIRNDFETPLRNNLKEFFNRAINAAPESEELKKVLSRIIKVTGSEKQKSFKISDKIFSQSDAFAVANLIKENKFNYLLREGLTQNIDLDQLNKLRNIFNTATPIGEDTVVYRGIRTKKIWDDCSELDFSKNIYEGAIFEDKGLIATSRVYDDELAKVDPFWLEEENAGYIMRIKLPKETKGIDCRRFSGMDSDKGINSIFYLPENSKFRISKINEEDQIIDCELVL